jgi:protein CpxP
MYSGRQFHLNGEVLMKSRFIASVVALLLVLGIGLAWAQAAHRSREWSGAGAFGIHGRMAARIASELQLTDAQQEQIKSILQAEKNKVQPLWQQLAQTEQQILTATKGGTFDENQVRSIATQQAQLRTEMIVERARLKAEIYKVLTPEQRTKADSMQERMIHRVHKHGAADSQAGSTQPQGR